MSEKPVSRFDLLAPSRAQLAVWCGLLGAVRFSAVPGLQHKSGTGEVRVAVGGIESRIDAAGTRLDLNSATEAQLALLPGMTPKKARAIVAERERRGAFQSIWQLEQTLDLTLAAIRKLEPLLRAEPR